MIFIMVAKTGFDKGDESGIGRLLKETNSKGAIT
jgi:hypothetical protein